MFHCSASRLKYRLNSQHASVEAYTLWKCNVCVRPELNLTAKWTKYLKDLLPTTLNISSWTCALTNVSVRIVNKARVLTGNEFNDESFIMSHCTHSSDLILLLLFSWCCRAKVSCHHLSLFCFCLFFSCSKSPVIATPQSCTHQRAIHTCTATTARWCQVTSTPRSTGWFKLNTITCYVQE